ncbi:MAG TPA: hypothetical protein VGO58_05475 [Chitinophagaceae bacterium]|jgi:hypothetical protein|nr:hypothetical protein [Chitinophagaceae bacterium]
MKRTLQISLLLALVVLMMIQCNVIWRSPQVYHGADADLQPPIMTLEEYTSSGIINTHVRPYFYTIENTRTRGAVLVFGAEHINDPADKQFDQLRTSWKQFNPTVALVEGRLGFLFSWTQDPVKRYGESGLTAKLARKAGIRLYSWDPEREAQVDELLRVYDPLQVGAFFSLRPYLNKYPNLSKSEQDKMMDKLIRERTDHKGIRGILVSTLQLDSLWKADYPGELNWRTYQHPENGWPEGKLKLMAIRTNDLRDELMCRSVIELVNKGERVFVTMGTSHAPRVEKTLKHMIR